jgi:subtilisin-like proprotein convertase family protein
MNKILFAMLISGSSFAFGKAPVHSLGRMPLASCLDDDGLEWQLLLRATNEGPGFIYHYGAAPTASVQFLRVVDSRPVDDGGSVAYGLDLAAQAELFRTTIIPQHLSKTLTTYAWGVLVSETELTIDGRDGVYGERSLHDCAWYYDAFPIENLELRDLDRTIPEQGELRYAFTVPTAGRLEEAELTLDIEHRDTSELAISLKSPDGRIIRVGRRGEDLAGFYDLTPQLAGLPAGTWELIVADRVHDPLFADRGVLHGFRMRLVLAPSDAPIASDAPSRR